MIEPRVLMAGNVYISDHTHEHRSRTIAIKDQGVTSVSPVRIREGAWLGQNVVICPGVTVGRNAVVGANSVVRNDVPDFCIFAGAPAKFIRKIDEHSPRSRELLESVQIG
ncbi:MAG TPA: acyltransferase [Chthoniobacterales bacterium]|nr:acyltransferase [Chthoniobacterales bacterium]